MKSRTSVGGGQISEPLHSFSLYIPLVKCTLHKSMKNVSERMIHTGCVWSMQLWQKVVVQKISKFPISVETQLSSTAPFIKCSLCEKSLKGKQFALQLGGLSDKTLWICKLQCCICCQILIINLNINWEKSVIYGRISVNYEEKSFMKLVFDKMANIYGFISSTRYSLAGLRIGYSQRRSWTPDLTL